MPPRPKPKAEAMQMDYNDLVRKRDAFVTSMTLLRNAADECSRTGLAFFELVAQSPGMPTDTITYARGMSMPPSGRAQTEEPETKKRKRQTKPKDPNAPKKPATPYFLFCSAGRETVKSDLGPDVKYPDIQAELKSRWEALTDDEKKGWSNLYHDKFDAWKTEINKYNEGKAIAEAGEGIEVAANGEAAPALPTARAPPVQTSFTAVNRSPPPAEESEEDEDEEMAEAGKVSSADESEQSELTPPPPPPTKVKATPKKKVAEKKTVTAKEIPTEKKARKPRAKKADKEKEPEPEPGPEEVEEEVDAEPEPEKEKKRERRKRRKSGAE